MIDLIQANEALWAGRYDRDRSAITLDSLAAEFKGILGIEAPKTEEFERQALVILKRLSVHGARAACERKRQLLALVNKKFGFNSSGINALLAKSAESKISFNYHEKRRIADAFDYVDPTSFQALLDAKDITFSHIKMEFRPIPEKQTVELLHKELVSPTLIRKDSRPKDWSNEIRKSLFGGFIYSSFHERDIHELFDRDKHANSMYQTSFWVHLHQSRPELFSRTKTLVYFECSEPADVGAILYALKNEFTQLSNHGFFALNLLAGNGQEWRTAAIATLFAEKFIQQKISNGYFRWRDIEKETRKYIENLPSKKMVGFENANLGYHYKDTFIIGGDKPKNLLLLFQKNLPDETPIPCPACRSRNVQGNSYSSLGVRSWECTNQICPDRSKFNRGKRYSFYQLLKQQAIEAGDALIPVNSVRSWARDVQPDRTRQSIFEMLIRHYTLPGDGVLHIGSMAEVDFGRNIKSVAIKNYLKSGSNDSKILADFRSSSLFARFCVKHDPKKSSCKKKINLRGAELLLGDCRDILTDFPDAFFDGAVTSPPYYNAREYAQWPNIYCFLYDMYNAGREIFRTLKPGAIYLFNVFDYFDNENTIVKSAMGNKRMILSSYLVESFEKIGFSCIGNIVWDKGEIEGKRAFNNGNFSPYYQAPFNCWEHIFIFKKPGNEVMLKSELPNILRQKPVHKMVKGINRHGHSAPFPDAIPELLLKRLPPNSKIIDPFAGSMTSGRVAARIGHQAVCIEKDESYFNLGLSMFEAEGSE